ncbi:MAG TPA: cytochrome c oxidase subunit II [Chloroflexota bacterium]|nr:cytochrome c oxidase subunit II [Chloroflexota bacterium]
MAGRGQGLRKVRAAALRGSGALFLAVLLSGCDSYPFSPIKPAGTVARQDDNLYEIVTVIALVVGVLVMGLIVYSAIRFGRRKGDPDEEPRQVHGNTALEVTWTFIPIVIVGLLFALAVQTLQATIVPLTAPKGSITINVIGHQWVWEYQYPQYGIDYFQQYSAAVPVDGMHIPINRQVILNITGADVQHGWWVPALAGKNEATPGHWNHQEFNATKLGTYYAVCSYYCGTDHFDMLANVVVQTQADFDRWLVKNRPTVVPTAAPTVPGTPTAGPSGPAVSFKADIQPIFTAHCAACHISTQLGGLSLASYAGLQKGGTLVPGPVFKAGNHAQSLLWKMVQPGGGYPGGNRMPLGGPYLTPAQIQSIASWIDQGAKNN